MRSVLLSLVAAAFVAVLLGVGADEPASASQGPITVHVQGAVNCGDIDAEQVVFLLGYAAGVHDGTTLGPCPDLGVNDIEAFGHPWGDMNCDNAVNALDALYLEAQQAGVTMPLPDRCPAVGETIFEDYNDLFFDIGREVPRFAGIAFDPDPSSNNLIVWMTTDDFDMAALQSSITARFPETVGKPNVIVKVQFDWAQLMGWYRVVQDALFANPDVEPYMTSTDIDEAHNQIRIGVETEGAKSAAEAVVATLDVPSDAVKIVIEAPATSVTPT